MTVLALQALQASILHWERMLAQKRANDNERPGSAHCALCQHFNRHQICTGCPVFERTGHPGCVDTPYFRANCAWACWFSDMPSSVKAWRAACQEEIDFLKSLLPVDKGPGTGIV
jgi:hypothetical protein